MVVAVISYFQQNLAGHAEIFGESTRTRGLACVSTRWTSINVRADARAHDAGPPVHNHVFGTFRRLRHRR